MRPEVAKLTLLWNDFIYLMQRSEEQWEKLRVALEEIGATNIELQHLPTQVQRGLAMFGRSKYSVMLSRFADYFRTVGGIETMLVDIGKERENARSGSETESGPRSEPRSAGLEAELAKSTSRRQGV